MIKVTFNVDRKQLWVGNLLSTDRLKEIERLSSRGNMASLNHQRFILPHSILGEQGFQHIQTIEQQAFCQVLAHHGCIPSALLFGLSLADCYPPSRRISCAINAYQYMFVGLEAMLQHHEEPGFVQESEFIVESKVLFDICHYIVQRTNKNVKYTADVIGFANIYLAGTKHFIKLDA